MWPLAPARPSRLPPFDNDPSSPDSNRWKLSLSHQPLLPRPLPQPYSIPPLHQHLPQRQDLRPLPLLDSTSAADSEVEDSIMQRRWLGPRGLKEVSGARSVEEGGAVGGQEPELAPREASRFVVRLLPLWLEWTCRDPDLLMPPGRGCGPAEPRRQCVRCARAPVTTLAAERGGLGRYSVAGSCCRRGWNEQHGPLVLSTVEGPGPCPLSRRGASRYLRVSPLSMCARCPCPWVFHKEGL